MSQVNLTDDQVIDLFAQLSPERKRAALYTLAKEAQSLRDNRMKYGEDQIRKVCRKRGIDWDRMAEEEQETLIDDLVHEDR